MPDNYAVSSSFEPEDEDFKNMKNARRKLGIPMPAAMPRKTPINSGGQPTAVLGKTRQNMLVLSKLTSPREFDWKELLTGTMNHIAAKGINLLRRYNLAHKFIPMPEALKIPDAKAAVEK